MDGQQTPEAPSGLGGGRVLVGGIDRGGGVAIGPRTVVTAKHVVRSASEDAPISYMVDADQIVTISSPLRNGDTLDAALLELDSEVAYLPVANARAQEAWFARQTNQGTDPILTGKVSSVGVSYVDDNHNSVSVLQLLVDQDLGGFKGYSGTGVVNDDGKVVGILIEQKFKRLGIPRPEASNVLFAVRIADVVDEFEIKVDLAPPALGVYLREAFAPLVEHYTKVFAGRLGSLATIESFMANADGGYFVITGPEGIGKTALAANIISRHPSELAYHFFTRWYGSTGIEDTNGLSERFFLQNVIQQLSWMRGYEDRLPESIVELRARYHHLLSEPVTVPQSLIIDGLDEVTTWSVGPYLSGTLPANFHVIVTAREAGAERSGDAGIPAAQTSRLELGGLDRTEVAAALSAIDGWAADSAARDSVLDEVMRVTAYDAEADFGADPLYFRFLLEDAASGALTPADLAKQPQGWEAYLKKWWAELRGVAGDEAARDCLGTMAAALGPLHRADLERINPSLHAASEWDADPLDAVLKEGSRFLFGTEERGWVLSRRRLREYLLSKIEAKQYEDRLVAFCGGWESHQSPYALSYYVSHLIRADDKTLYGLIGKSWIEARSKTSTYHAAADDARQVIEVASREDPPNLTQEVRHSLIYTNFGTFTTTLLPDAFQLLAELGEEELGRSLAALLPDDDDRVTAEIALGRGLLARGEGDSARRGLMLALRRAGPQNLPALAAVLWQLGNIDDVRAAIDGLGDDGERARVLAAAARSLAADGQREFALALAATIGDGKIEIEVLADVAQESVKSGVEKDAIVVSHTALAIAEALLGPEARAHGRALVARAFARAGAIDTAVDLATKALADLASCSADWRLLETVCVVAQALAPTGDVEIALHEVGRIAEAAETSTVVPPAPVSGGGPHEREPQDDDRDGPDPNATEYERAKGLMERVEEACRSVVAEGLTFRNLVSPVPSRGLIVLSNVGRADEIRANALSWVAQSLADEVGYHRTRSDMKATWRATADAVLAALDTIAAAPTTIHPVAWSYVSLLLARAEDGSRATEVITRIFDTLASSPTDLDVYRCALSALAPALVLTGDVTRAMNAINDLGPAIADPEAFVREKTALIKEVARLLLLQGDINTSMGFGLSVEDPEAKASVLASVADTLGEFLAPDDVLVTVLAIAFVEGSFVESLPPEYVAPVLTSAAKALTAIGQFDLAKDLLIRVLEAGIAIPHDPSDTADLLLDIAGALADVGQAEAARGAFPLDLRETKENAEPQDESSRVPSVIRAAQILDDLGDTARAGKLLMSLGEGLTNRAYALSDHALAVARTGDVDGALAAVEAIPAGPIRASGMSRIAVNLARSGAMERSEALASEALELIAGTVGVPAARSGAGGDHSRHRQVAPWNTQFAPGDEELKEGSSLLSRALGALPTTGDEPLLPDVVVSAVVAASAAESRWVGDVGIDDILRRMLTRQTEAAAADLLALRATLESSTADVFHCARALRWVAELLIYVGHGDLAASIAGDISKFRPDDESRSFLGTDWRVDIPRRLSEALATAGEGAGAKDVAEAALRAALHMSDPAERARAVNRTIRTFAAIGQPARALELWHQELSSAREAGRERFIATLAAGAAALATIDGGQVLQALLGAVNEVEGWWGTLQIV